MPGVEGIEPLSGFMAFGWPRAGEKRRATGLHQIDAGRQRPRRCPGRNMCSEARLQRPCSSVAKKTVSPPVLVGRRAPARGRWLSFLLAGLGRKPGGCRSSEIRVDVIFPVEERLGYGSPKMVTRCA